MSLTAYDYVLNLDRRVVTIDWEVLGCGEYRLREYQSQGESIQCGPFNLTADVYLNR